MKLFNPFRRSRVRSTQWHDYGVISYAQEGEDRLLGRLLGQKPEGFFVDVGAHHPQRFSNTFAFYLQGWRGINIDPGQGTKSLFDRLRPGDINLETAVGEAGPRVYYQFAESALNSCDGHLAQTRQETGFPILHTEEIQAVPLVVILDEHVPPGHLIDFLTVDVEGMDLEVLQSNDWDTYRPRLVLAEDHGVRKLEDAADSAIVAYMLDQGYCAVAKTFNTLFFCQTSRSIG